MTTNNFEMPANNNSVGGGINEELGFTSIESVENSLKNINTLIETYGESADLKTIKANIENNLISLKN